VERGESPFLGALQLGAMLFWQRWSSARGLR
jgi:hypothetical protein